MEKIQESDFEKIKLEYSLTSGPSRIKNHYKFLWIYLLPYEEKIYYIIQIANKKSKPFSTLKEAIKSYNKL